MIFIAHNSIKRNQMSLATPLHIHLDIREAIRIIRGRNASHLSLSGNYTILIRNVQHIHLEGVKSTKDKIKKNHPLPIII